VCLLYFLILIVLLEKLIVTQIVKKFSNFYGSRRFITATGLYPEPDASSQQLTILFP